MNGLPRTTITVKGLISRPNLNTDGITNVVVYNDNISDLTVFSTTNRIVKFTNLESVQSTGITATSTNFKETFYQLKNYFNAGGSYVNVGIFEEPETFDFSEIDTMNLFTKGEASLWMVCNPQQELSVTEIAKVNNKIAALTDLKKPAHCFYYADTSTLTLSELPNLRTLASDCPYVSVVIGIDVDLTNVYYNCGIVTGTASSTSVNTSILNTGLFNYTNGVDMVNVGLFLSVSDTPTKVDIKTISESDLDLLNDKGYIFFRYITDLLGTYLSNDNNSTKISDTFNSVHMCRTRNKSIRQLNIYLSKLIGATVLFNPDGTMKPISVAVYEDAARTALNYMKQPNEISDFAVYVDPTQNVLSTKTVVTNASIIPTETSDYLPINIAFTQNI